MLVIVQKEVMVTWPVVIEKTKQIDMIFQRQFTVKLDVISCLAF
jgi:hypothetical protein